VPSVKLPRGIAALDVLLTLALIAGSRLLARTLMERPTKGIVARRKEVLVVGAGEAGQLVIRALLRHPQPGYAPIGLIDGDLRATAAYVRDQTVLVTGAGGSIGSELCRQIAKLGPQRLVLVDQGETALFEIERELVDERGFTASVPVLGDCKNRTKMRQVF